MINNYDKIANHYDKLSRLVFFKSQVNAQIDQLKNIPANSMILIVGGGTGWILEEISKIHDTGLHITYVEISSKMTALSKARNWRNNKAEFINTGIENFETDQHFDVILTPFLFDNFNQDRVTKVFQRLNLLMKVKGLWLLVDFSLNKVEGQWWKWLILKAMYSFFKLIRIVEATSLIDMEPYFNAAAYTTLNEQFYYGHFIKASVFRKEELREF
jgi:ubiquinone/menaquinone biosynthesis C-methylase UbiE